MYEKVVTFFVINVERAHCPQVAAHDIVSFIGVYQCFANLGRELGQLWLWHTQFLIERVDQRRKAILVFRYHVQDLFVKVQGAPDDPGSGINYFDYFIRLAVCTDNHRNSNKEEYQQSFYREHHLVDETWTVQEKILYWKVNYIWLA